MHENPPNLGYAYAVSTPYSFGRFKIDPAVGKLWRDSEEIGLPIRAFETLAYLVRHSDRTVGKEELIKEVWGGTFVSDDSLVHCVSVIRRALGDDTERPQFIATVPRRGYRFVGQVTRPESVATDAPAIGVAPAPVTIAHGSTFWRRYRLGIVAASLALAAATTVLVRSNSSLDSLFEPILLNLLPPPGTTLASGGVLSPDHRRLAFVARDQPTGISQIWVRTLDLPTPQAIPGTTGGSKVFWSPDGGSIGFFAGNKLKTVALASGAIKTLATLTVSPAGGSWGPGGLILFGDLGRGLRMISAAGGDEKAVTALNPGEDVAHAWPCFLPDGKHFLYTVTSWDSARAGVWYASLDAPTEARRLMASVSGAVYAPPGYLVYFQNTELVARPFDPDRAEVRGKPLTISQSVPVPTLRDDDNFSVSGSLVSFRSRTKTEHLTWFGRDGEAIGNVSSPTPLYNPVISPDGNYIAGTGALLTNPGLWLIDVNRNMSTRLNTDGIGPVWSPDGQQIAYTTNGGLEIHIRPALDSGHDVVVLRDGSRKVLQDWSPDGHHLVYSMISARHDLDLWLLSLSGTPQQRPLLVTPANERQARISPDGRWMAYTSDESGKSEVYVEEFPKLGSRRVVSVDGGAEPAWLRNGKELFYLTLDGTLRSAATTVANSISIGPDKALFRVLMPGDVLEARNHYAVSANGQTFLFKIAGQSPEPDAITMVVNWRSR